MDRIEQIEWAKEVLNGAHKPDNYDEIIERIGAENGRLMVLLDEANRLLTEEKTRSHKHLEAGSYWRKKAEKIEFENKVAQTKLTIDQSICVGLREEIQRLKKKVNRLIRSGKE